MPRQSYPDWIKPDPWVPPGEPVPAPPPEAAPPDRKWPLAAALFPAGAVLGFLAVLLFGWLFGSGHSKPRQVPSAVPLPTITTPPVTQPSDPSGSVLAQLVVTQADVPPEVSVQLIPGGNQVVGQATLDLCSGDFPSESKRKARLQVSAVDDLGRPNLSTEAVLYKDEAATAQGFAELRSVAAKCTEDTMKPPPDGSWPAVPTVERQAYDFISSAGGQPQHSVAVYLRRGRVLMGVYFPQPDGDQSPVMGKTTIPDIVTVFANRIAALPASVVNG
jgi:hypothetical protein